VIPYQPRHFKVEDRETALALMQSAPLATVVSVHAGEVEFSYLPLVARRRDEAIVLLGHLARANPHWRHWTPDTRLTAIFHGPDSFVSPSWYATREMVPTWNYIVVHAAGRVTTTDDSVHKERILKALIDAHDPPYRERWDGELSESYREGHKSHIIGFELAVERIEAKFKLSQNRLPADHAGVLAAMEQGGAAQQALGAWMRELKK
jgi:transcriptional regulator